MACTGVVAGTRNLIVCVAGMLVEHQMAARASGTQTSTLIRRSILSHPRYYKAAPQSHGLPTAFVSHSCRYSTRHGGNVATSCWFSSRTRPRPLRKDHAPGEFIRSNWWSTTKQAGFVSSVPTDGLCWRRLSTVKFGAEVGSKESEDVPYLRHATRRQVAEPGVVYFVATPIGNLEDITLRALNIMRTADIIAAEDTRTTGRLLKLLGVERAGKLVSYHEHNSRRRVPEIIDAARNGKSVAVVSDAGTPGFSDPGRELTAACATEGLRVVPIPGACAAVAAMSVTGFPSNEFVFFGFVGGKRGSATRRRKLVEIAREPRPCILYESPHRIADTLGALLTAFTPAEHEKEQGHLDAKEIALAGDGQSQGPGDDKTRLTEEDVRAIGHDNHGSIAVDTAMGSRPVVIARELTKLHEEVFHGTLSEAVERYGPQIGGNSPMAGGAREVKGEFTVVLGPHVFRPGVGVEEAARARHVLKNRLLELTRGGMSISSAVKMVSKDLGLKKSDVYRVALALPTATAQEEI